MKEQLGERIRRKRTEHRLGLRETAAKIGISPTYLSRIETMDEKRPPAEDVLRKLAELLQDDLDLLMDLAGRMPEEVEQMIKGDRSMRVYLRTVNKQKLSGDDLLMQLTGRVPEDVERILKADPSLHAFLRTASEQRLSGHELMKILAERKAKK